MWDMECLLWTEMLSRNSGAAIMVDRQGLSLAWAAHVREVGLGRFDDVHQLIA